MIDSQELNYPDKDYHVGNLEMPEPILSEKGSFDKSPPVHAVVKSNVGLTGTGM